LGIAAMLLIQSSYSFKNKLIVSFLRLLWIWRGLVYHTLFFATVNKSAFVFGAAFIVQGLLILLNAFRNNKLTFSFSAQTKDYLAYFFICWINYISNAKLFYSGSIQQNNSNLITLSFHNFYLRLFYNDGE